MNANVSAKKVVKKSDLSKWQADRIRKDAELAKYLHIDSEVTALAKQIFQTICSILYINFFTYFKPVSYTHLTLPTIYSV